ncbi:MAG: nitroreductase [Deltaproteobacteria bacterium]|nr:nitroreductase [Deltaproteobacteria bacterium]
MELMETVKNRRSVRSFLPRPIERGIIEEMLSDALWAPSWGNTQPWEIVVVTGDLLATFKEENKQAVISGKQPDPDITMPLEWPEINKKRYQDVGRRTLEALSIPRKDAEARLNFYTHMMGLFDAPTLLLITVDKALSLEYSMLDAGLFIQTLCLLAHERGLGTCIMAAAVQYPDILRTLFEIPDTRRIVIGVALGWPDQENPVNTFGRARGNLDEFVRWVE